MYYYEVLVASQRYHGDGPLTYASKEQLPKGSITTVPMQRQKVLGVITKRVNKPSFATKEILAVAEHPPLPAELVKLVWWLKEYYPAPIGQIMGLLLPTTLMQKSRASSASKTSVRDGIKRTQLTAEQKVVVNDITHSDLRMHMLHGETGSGKTRVYTELIAESLKSMKSTILLTPEIGLTSQLAQTIEETFPGAVLILHSNLTPAQRRDRWHQIISTENPLVVIGPRSALFAPLRSIGLIILDEAHDTAYKQEQAPHYLASRVAAKLAELHGAKVVLGTATPLVSDYYTFMQKKLPIHRMQDKAITSTFNSSTELINLGELSNFTRSRWISNQIIEAIQENLTKDSQSLLFLNRRGSARIILCQNCGWHAVCPNCDITLTYHADQHHMKCHTCGYKQSAPSSCPQCRATDITFKSIGTKAIAEEIERLFPDVDIYRLDGDSAKADRLENQYDDIKSGKAKILIGTQVISKGLDLPKLGLVGIILADTGLNFPDFTAEERTYQLLSQVMGRADRGHQDTKVYIQTFNPDNPTIKLASTKDFDTFYKQQLKERELFGFPPFKYLLKLEVERASSKAAETAANKLQNVIRNHNLKVSISNPAPAFIEKIHGKYRWHIVVKSANRSELTKVIGILPGNTSYDIDPTNLL